MKLLIIEDNRSVAQALRRQLSHEYIVELAYSAESGLQKLQANTYAVVLLDLSLPDKDGLTICKEVRASGLAVPILVLTGIDTVDSRVSLLRSGADDYLTKPFEIAELTARIAALSRRKDKVLADSIITFRDVSIDTIKREVVRAGVKVELRRKEYDILRYLIANAGRMVSREMIMQHVWESGRESWNNTIDVHIKHLRDRIDRPFEVPLIKTVYGIGYMVDDGQV